MYRPEGWKKGIKVVDDKKRYTGKDLNTIYEAGADAECDGIIKAIESMPHGTTHCDILRVLRGEDES